MEDDPSSGGQDLNNQCNSHVLRVLEALKQASHHLQSNPIPNSSDSDSSAIKALLELEIKSESILSTDSNLYALSQHLSKLKSHFETLEKSQARYSVKCFFARRVSSYSIARLARSIESEIQAWIDRESVENLSHDLEIPIENEERLIKLLTQFENRVSQGFNREFQDLILKSKLFMLLESILCNEKCSKKIREHSAFAIAALIRFNKNVFVGEVFMGTTVQALVTMASPYSIKVLCGLIKTIKSPLIDEIYSNGEIPKIITLFSSKTLEIQFSAMDCVFEMGYSGRREAIESMIEEGLIEKLIELQRSELGGDSIDMEKHPFAKCVARFAVQIEVGEGLGHKERREMKQEILVRVKKSSVCDAEMATIVAEVLWGSSP